MKINQDEILGISDEGEKYFSWKGCENCGNKLGNDVYDCKASFCKDGKWDHYDVQLCGDCLCAVHNGDPLPEDCRNLYNI